MLNLEWLLKNARRAHKRTHAKKQSKKFLEAKSPPDFAAEDYEVNYAGRATINDLTTLGKKQMALESWD